MAADSTLKQRGEMHQPAVSQGPGKKLSCERESVRAEWAGFAFAFALFLV